MNIPIAHVVIVGGGFAGLTAAKEFSKSRIVRVTLIDQRNYHLFQPLLYQVATAGLNPADIAVPIRSEFAEYPHIAVHLGEVRKIDLAGNYIVGGEPDAQRTLYFDYLILACGVEHSYFGNPQWEDFAPGLKTLEQATEIRRRILLAFEHAENEIDLARQKALLTFVVVGGGPTGVELAGAIADISRRALVKDFRRINPASARILLVEAGNRVLSSFDESLSRRAEVDLRKLGVEVRTSQPVTAIDAGGVFLGEERIEALNVIWAAGVKANAISNSLGVELDRVGRVKVLPDLSIPTFPNCFVAGDLAHVTMDDGNPVPGLAPAAIQMGKCAAQNILATIAGENRIEFQYIDRGQMATIGKKRAIAQTGRFKFAGFPAWIAWLVIHILYLIGFKNRVAVFFGWVWSYIFSKQGARLITNREWKL